MTETKHLSIPVDDVLPELSSLVRYTGDILKGSSETFLTSARSRIKIKSGYSLHHVRIAKMIIGENFSFHPGPVISDLLMGCSRIAVFAVTLGIHFDIWCKSFNRTNDILGLYIADRIGSLAAEKAAEILHKKIASDLSKEGFSCTNRFSPGYCGWNVAEQKTLFKLLPDNFCDIKLTDAALMEPLKSISGIIGAGENVQREEYPCSKCEVDCLNRYQE